ncbi:MAG: (deoxy)nucleoside triphosphate pyrophosphohydrolase [Bacteroidota bacterium]
MITVTCAIILFRGRVLAAQRSADMSLPLKWEFPGGKLEPGEAPEICVVREIEEELRLAVRVLERAPTVMHQISETKEMELIPYVCIAETDVVELQEHAQVKWCDTEELGKLDWARADIEVLRWWETIGREKGWEGQ